MDPHTRYLTMADAMSKGIPGLRPPGGPPPRWAWAATVAGAAGIAAAITLVWHAQRAILAIGGSCAQGGPYLYAQPCPDGSITALTIAFPLGFLALGLLVCGAARLCRGGARVAALAWPVLFLLLGGTFLAQGLGQDADGAGPAAGWLLCGVLFAAMGAVPLLGVPMALRGIGPGRLRLAVLTSAGVLGGVAAASVVV